MRQLLASVLVVGACSSGKPMPNDSFDDLNGLDEKSDSFSYRMRILGSVDYGTTTDAAKYTKSPRYRAYKFGGYEEDRVDVWVRSDDGGDAVTWLLDNSFHVLASSDDADDSTLDSHIVYTLPASSSITHYIVYRDYSLSTAHFSVDLAVQPYSTLCTADTDCVAVDRGGCCTDGSEFAVAAGQEDAYAAAVACTVTPRPYCPQHVIDDTRVAQCNNDIGRCHMIAPEDIRCGGFTAHPHACPTGYTCHYDGVPDIPGHCIAQQQP